MATRWFHLCAHAPFDFQGYCCRCHLKTTMTIALDVKYLGDALAGAAIAHPVLALADIIVHRPVHVPYCHRCRMLLWLVRILGWFVFAGLLTSVVGACAGCRPDWLNENVALVVFLGGLVGMMALAPGYYWVKHRLVGVWVAHRDNVFLYSLRSAAYPQFLARNGLCQPCPGDEATWLAPDCTVVAGVLRPTPAAPKTAQK